MKNLILMGIKHCGKTTQGRLLSAHFGCPFFDTDDLILEMTGKTPRQIYSEEGREAFLEAEARSCEFLRERGGEFVVATGGGICQNGRAISALRGIGTFVFLNSDEEIAFGRIVKEIRILENGSLENLPAYIAKENPDTLDEAREIFHKFYAERKKIYRSICNLEVEMLQITKNENLSRILHSLKTAGLA